MVYYHPHGLIPNGFALNGAVRARAQDNATYLPPWLPLNATVSGVQAPVLFKVPILRHILLGFGCCVPATKAGVRRLLADRTTFGIIPGGSEEVALHEAGRENLYLRKRAGFLKYALQAGYTIVIAFTFGESDLYSSVKAVRPLNLWLVRKFGFVLPIFWGFWLFPLLPRCHESRSRRLSKWMSGTAYTCRSWRRYSRGIRSSLATGIARSLSSEELTSDPIAWLGFD